MVWNLIKNQKDWIRYENSKRREIVTIITYGKRFKWDLEIKEYDSRPILRKMNITKTTANKLAKSYMKKNN